MKNLILGLGILIAGASFGQKKVTCSYQHPSLPDHKFSADFTIPGKIVNEEDVKVNPSLYKYHYADFDGSKITFTELIVNKKTKQCDHLYSHSIEKKNVNWAFNNMFNSASTEKTLPSGKVEVKLGGGAFGGDLSKVRVIVPISSQNYVENRKTANCIFKDAATHKAFFAEVMK